MVSNVSMLVFSMLSKAIAPALFTCESENAPQKQFRDSASFLQYVERVLLSGDTMFSSLHRWGLDPLTENLPYWPLAFTSLEHIDPGFQLCLTQWSKFLFFTSDPLFKYFRTNFDNGFSHYYV